MLLSISSCKAKEEKESTDNKIIEEESTVTVEKKDSLPDGSWQCSAVFPNRLGHVDDTLAMNSMLSFDGYSDQGELYITADNDINDFDLYINSVKIDINDLEKDVVYHIDFSPASINGKNTLQVSGIKDETNIAVYIPYPILKQGNLEEEGFDQASLQLISDIIETDIENGFSSAQLAIIRHGKLVYSNTWGYLNSYNQNNQPLENKIKADNSTMYDLASVSKMFGPNYALQKLISEGKLSVDDHIYEYLGERFYEDTMDFTYTFGADVDLETMKAWKKSLTIADLLKHEGGFPPAPRYFNLYLDAASQEDGEEYENLLYSGNEHSEKTKLETINAICKTPLVYKPGSRTLYSDVDYMILGHIVEIVSGMSLDEYMKENFFEPLDLSRISYNPLENGFSKNDCAATEINGNTRDGVVYFPGVRTETIQGEVHDEMAWYSMNGVSGHAGIFANAEDLAKLAYVMLNGGYGNYHFFDQNVIDYFKSPKSISDANYGLGWARQADDERSWYYGSQATSDTIGHQGWTGTLVMIDYQRDIVMAYLTNERNTPLTNKYRNANDFEGLWYTASTLGFVPQLFSIGLDDHEDHHKQLLSLLYDMTKGSITLVENYAGEIKPSIANAQSKLIVYRKWIDEYGDDQDKKAFQELQEYFESIK